MGISSKSLQAAAGAAACLLLLALGSAQGEVVRKGNLQGSFSGSISPQRLPRTGLAPVAVTMGGKITTTDRSVPPKLERITLAINSHGKLQAFNGKLHGRPAVLAQVSSGAPLPLTYVIGFEVKKAKGTFGTQLVATLPPIASEYGYISAFSLSLSRRYESHGKQMSFASASCPAPKGISSAPFPFVKASYAFADGRSLEAILNRDCKVKG
jgi:hypothetical protein